MDKKNLLYIGVGIALGFFLAPHIKRYISNTKSTDSSLKNQQNSSGEPHLQVTKATNTQEYCEAKWNEKSKNLKLSQQALNTAKESFITSCMFPKGI
jgi:hypothetical protein